MEAVFKIEEGTKLINAKNDKNTIKRHTIPYLYFSSLRRRNSHDPY